MILVLIECPHFVNNLTNVDLLDIRVLIKIYTQKNGVSGLIPLFY